MNYERSCLRCGAKIEACIGFVIARDFLQLSLWSQSPKPRGEPPKVREICGKCGLLPVEELYALL